MKYSITPWLTVANSLKALEFYRRAFDAIEAYRMDVPDGVIARLSIHGAEFWISDGNSTSGPEPSVRMILSVPEPDILFDQVVNAGATVMYPMSEEHGWRIGRVVDPFGHHWEIGKQIAS